MAINQLHRRSMKLYATLFVWNEEDIIGATVKNAFAQGVDKVFLIDNGCTDKTVHNAVSAGATLIHKVDSGFLDVKLRYATVNAVISQVNKNERASSIWWLILDADEFPETRLGISIRQYLEALDSDVNLVAAEVLNHLPTHPPYNIPGYHPIHFQPLNSHISMHKLPLIRYDAGKPHIMSMAGAHTYHTADGSYLTGTDHKLLFHHFNYRKPETSQARLKELTAERPDGTRRIDSRDSDALRIAGAKSVYWERMEKMEQLFRNSRNRHILDFKPEDLTPKIPLWYSPEDVPASAFASVEEFLFWKAGTQLYARNYTDAAAIFTLHASKVKPEETEISLQAARLCLELAGS